MAKRRMFNMTIVDSDSFLDMPLSTQALYFHLNMRADDDGFVNNPKKIMRMIGSSDDEYKVLVAKNFLLGFESGVIVIKHWKLHNLIRNDRRQPTVYTEELEQLNSKENGTYTKRQPNDNQMTTICPPSIVEVSKEQTFSFTLKKLTSFENLSIEYKANLNEYINSCKGISYKDFEESCIMKGYKYKNFKMAYDKWNKSNINNIKANKPKRLV